MGAVGLRYPRVRGSLDVDAKTQCHFDPRDEGKRGSTMMSAGRGKSMATRGALMGAAPRPTTLAQPGRAWGPNRRFRVWIGMRLYRYHVKSAVGGV